MAGPRRDVRAGSAARREVARVEATSDGRPAQGVRLFLPWGKVAGEGGEQWKVFQGKVFVWRNGWAVGWPGGCPGKA